jgi:hypothetical protein
MRDEKCIQALLENLKGRDHSEDLGTDRKMLEQILVKWWEGVEWMRLAQDRNQWQAHSTDNSPLLVHLPSLVHS